MKALLYVALIYRGSDMSNISSGILSFLTGDRKSIKTGDTILQSPDIEIEFDDLGVSLMEYCRRINIPDFSVISGDYAAYIQVVPKTGHEPLRVYLESDFLEFLSKKGLGLDIHAQ